MFSRRNAIRTLGAGFGALSPLALQMQAIADGKERLQTRFVFVVRSNGVLTTEIQPQGLESLVKTRANGGWQTKEHIYSLSDRKLHDSLAPLEPWKSRTTIFQGLSGKMCRGSHNASFGALGAYASSSPGLPPRMATIDGALAMKLGGVFPHLGFAMDDFGKTISYPPLSARGPNQILPFYADPVHAYGDLFGTVASGKAKTARNVDQNVLDFLVDDVKRFQKGLSDTEKEKLNKYLHGFESIQRRRQKLSSMNRKLAEIAPELRPEFQSKIETERLEAHFELATAALIGGLTQVTTIRADSMAMRLTGLGLGAKTVHQMGHMIEGEKGGAGGASFDDGKGEFAARGVVMSYHVQLIADMAARLDAVPEGDGTMLDNTVILYLSDHGDRHHSRFYEWPMIAVGNSNRQLSSGRYVHVPGYGAMGHRTIANLYVTLLHVAGHPQDEFGQKDLSLAAEIDQSGPLSQWMA